AVLNEKGEPVFINAFLAHDKLKILLTRLQDLWQTNVAYLNLNAANVMKLVRQQHSSTVQSKWDPKTLPATVQKVITQLDKVDGGFVGRPKFPSEAMLLFLLDQLTRADDWVLADLVELQLDKMSAKGMYDSIHGGFHRYSTDSQWLVPHYEKMLYNQGQLLMVYAQAAKVYGKPRYIAIVKDTIKFIRQWLYQPGEGLYSAIDADFKSKDGAFYLRTTAQLAQVSDPQRKAAGMQTYPFEHSPKLGIYFKQPNTQASKSIRKLLAGQLKQKPHIDKKIITAWNALVIWGLADAWQVLKTPDIKQLATNLGQTLWSELYSQSAQQLYRSSFNHSVVELGTLEDYAFFAKALIRLFDITADKIWLNRATLLAKAALNKFKDNSQGFVFSEQQSGNTLAVNVTKTRDAEVLAAGAVMVEVLQDLWLRTGDVFYRKQLKSSANHLKGRFSADPVNHLYAAKVLNNHQHKNTVSKQYFAGGRGTVELFDPQAVCRGEQLALKVNLQPHWHVDAIAAIFTTNQSNV
ncbi:MAG: AGE family epimerase/isomerase, partial [Psychrosphaera sp.]|nr:AGE family epimerase/isomerase [Psychrosphaera sp.]